MKNLGVLFRRTEAFESEHYKIKTIFCARFFHKKLLAVSISWKTSSRLNTEVGPKIEVGTEMKQKKLIDRINFIDQ